MTSVAADYDHMEIQQQYSDVNNRWDVEEWDNENSSARLFERSRIKALAALSLHFQACFRPCLVTVGMS
ncbi:spectrin beta chain, non-erythrocytic 1 isoform X3 [Tachysurus ichikawai]